MSHVSRHGQFLIHLFPLPILKRWTPGTSHHPSFPEGWCAENRARCEEECLRSIYLRRCFYALGRHVVTGTNFLCGTTRTRCRIRWCSPLSVQEWRNGPLPGQILRRREGRGFGIHITRVTYCIGTYRDLTLTLIKIDVGLYDTLELVEVKKPRERIRRLSPWLGAHIVLRVWGYMVSRTLYSMSILRRSTISLHYLPDSSFRWCKLVTVRIYTRGPTV